MLERIENCKTSLRWSKEQKTLLLLISVKGLSTFNFPFATKDMQLWHT